MGVADGEAISSRDAEMLRRSAIRLLGSSGTLQNRFSMSQIATRASIGSTMSDAVRAPLAKSMSTVLVPKYPQEMHVSYPVLGHASKTLTVSIPNDDNSLTATSRY